MPSCRVLARRVSRCPVEVDQLVERSQQKLMPPGQLVFHVWPRLSSSIENRQFNNRKVNIQCGCCTVEYLSVK